MKILDLGCGSQKFKGGTNDRVIGVDFYNTGKAAVKWNLNKFPYPFKNNEFDAVVANHSIEHFDNTIKVIEELHRITKPNGVIKIRVPHFSSFMAWTHLTHKRAFGIGTFDNFEKGLWEKYSKNQFKIVKKELRWFRMRNYPIVRQFNWVIEKIININPVFSERFLCYALGGFDEVYFELIVIK